MCFLGSAPIIRPIWLANGGPTRGIGRPDQIRLVPKRVIVDAPKLDIRLHAHVGRVEGHNIVLYKPPLLELKHEV